MDRFDSVISQSLEGIDRDTPDTSDVADAATDTPVESTDDAPAPEASDAPTDGEPAPAAPVAETPVAETAPETKEESLETLAQEMAGKRDNRVPYSRVKAISANAEKKGYDRAVAEVGTKYAQYETPEFQNGLQALRVADQNPEQFLSALAQADPRYADLLAESRLTGGAQQQAPAAQRTAAPQGGSVEPDIQLSDGTLGYSADATARLLEQREALLAQQFDQKLQERMKALEPIEKDYRVAALRKEAATAVQGRIQAAKKWPGFTENQEAIGQAIADASAKKQSLDLHEAYIQVVFGKLQATSQAAEQTGYKKALDEVNKRAKGSSGVTPSAAPNKQLVTADPDADPIIEAIKASLPKR